MNKKIKYVFLLFLLFISARGLNAQWRFTPTLTHSGNCSQGDPQFQRSINELNTMLQQVYSQAWLPDKNTCEQIRNMVLSFQFDLGFCRIYYTCTQCSGTDMDAADQNSNQSFNGNLNFNNPNQGYSSFSPHAIYDIPNWMQDSELMEQILNGDFTSIEKAYSNYLASDKFIAPKTTNANSDKAYMGLSRDFAIGPRNGPEIPSIGYDIQRSEQMRRFNQQMQDALKELNQIERYCGAYPSDCGHYQQRKEELQKKLDEAKFKLAEERQQKAEDNINKQKQLITQYEEDIKNCGNDGFCRYNTEKALKEANKNLEELENAHAYKMKKDGNEQNGYEKDIARQAAAIDNNCKQISAVDTKEEIANEQLRRIDELEREGKIDAFTAMNMRKATSTEILTVQTVRTTTDAYERAKEITQDIKDGADVVKDMMIGKYDNDPDVAKYQTLTISNIYGIASSVTPDGPSQLLGMLSDGGKQLTNNRNVSSSALVYNSATGLGQDKAIEKGLGNYAPIYSKASQVYNITNEVIEGGGNFVNWYKATESAKQRNNSNK